MRERGGGKSESRREGGRKKEGKRKWEGGRHERREEGRCEEGGREGKRRMRIDALLVFIAHCNKVQHYSTVPYKQLPTVLQWKQRKIHSPNQTGPHLTLHICRHFLVAREQE